jgi:tRNA pseudouridine38-40 synthase
LTNDNVRLAFRIGYLGDSFHGSQIQPDVKTVQGELIRAFNQLNWLDQNQEGHNLVLSSRTDAGVNVRLNGGVVTIKRTLWEALTPRKMIRAIDDHLSDKIAFLDVHEVDDEWNPRIAKHRVYRYRLEGIESWQYPGEVFEEWLSLFIGIYDARNFARMEEGKNPMRKIYSCTPWVVQGRVVGFEIIGEAFLWNQVRRTAMALFKLSTGELTMDDIKNAISKPEISVDFGVAPPDWLVLWGVSWEKFPIPSEENTDFTFTAVPNELALERTMRSRWENGARLEMKSMLYHEWAYLGRLPIVRHNRD